MLYFDHSASTPPREEVIRTLTEVMARHYANPSSLHREGVETDRLLARARQVAAAAFGTEPDEWVFTSGGTESNNLAVLGAARRNIGRGTHLVTTEVEHPCVYDAFRMLEREGFEVTYIPVSSTGHVDPAAVEAAVTDRTVLVSVMHVNNETGAVQPIGDIGRRVKRRNPRTLFHSDGVQSIGKLPVELDAWGIDLFSGSAHKLRGPKGAGWLYVRKGTLLAPLVAGGEQELGLRPGTPNVPAIVAAAQALRLAMEEQPDRLRRMSRLRQQLVEGIRSIPELRLSGTDVTAGGTEAEAGEPAMAPHIVHFRYPGMKPEPMIRMLEKHRIVASTKSACASRLDKPSRVLLAMGIGEDEAGSGIRLSLGDEHGERDIRILLDMLRMTVSKLKPLLR